MNQLVCLKTNIFLQRQIHQIKVKFQNLKINFNISNWYNSDLMKLQAIRNHTIEKAEFYTSALS